MHEFHFDCHAALMCFLLGSLYELHSSKLLLKWTATEKATLQPLSSF